MDDGRWTMDDLSGDWGSGIDTICSIMGGRGWDGEFPIFTILGDGTCVRGGIWEIWGWILFVACGLPADCVQVAWEAGKIAGWEEMDEYDNYPVKK